MTEPLRIGVEVNVAPLADLSAAAQDVSRNIDQMAARFLKSGMAAKDVASALQNLGATEMEAAAAAGLLAEAHVAATTSMSGFERAAAMAGGRIAGADLGLGMMGGSLGRVAAFLPGLGQLFAAAFPIALIALAVEKIENYKQEVIKLSIESNTLAEKSQEVANSLGVENLKLGDVVDKLERRPSHNKLAEEMLTAQTRIDGLNVSLNETIGKLSEIAAGSWWDKTKDFLADVGAGMAPGSQLLMQHMQAKDLTEGAADKITDLRMQLSDLGKAFSEIDTSKKGGVAAATANLEKQKTLYEQIAAIEKANEAAQTDPGRKANIANAYIAAIDSVKILNEEELNLRLTEKSGIETNAHDLRAYWDTYTGGFAKVAAELAKHSAMWTEFYRHQTAEDAKAAEESARLTEEGQRRTAEQSAAISRQEVVTDIANATEVQRAVETSLKNIQATKEAALAGHVGIALQIIDTEQAKSGMAELQKDIASVTAEIERLKADMASNVVAGDTEGLIRYKSEIETLQELLAGLGEQYAKLSGQTQTFWQQFQAAEENAITVGANAFNQNFIKMTTGGEHFGRMMQATWTNMAESFITSTLKMAEKWVGMELMKLAVTRSTGAAATAAAKEQNLLTQFSAAKAAAAQAMTTVPFPFDLVVAPIVFAAALAFDKGGLVPGAMGTPVPAVVHGGEMVLPSDVSRRVQDSAGNAGHTINLHYNVGGVNALDSRGVADVLREHSEVLEGMMMDSLRRRNLT